MDEVRAIAARVAAGGGPWTLELYPTLACNLSCGFCDTTDRHRPPVHELGDDRLLALVDEAAAMGVQRVMVLGGGEPLLRKATPALLRRIKAHGLAGFLTTNGTLLGPALRALLVEIGWDEVHVSVDGATPATHDALRGHPGAFVRTVRNTCALRGGVRLGLHTVITRENVPELPAIVRLAHALGCARVDFDDLIAYRPEQRVHAVDDPAALRRAATEALAEAERLGIATTLARHTGALPARGLAPPAAGPEPGLRGAPCLKAWHHLVVQADGRVSPCCVLAVIGESVADQPLAAAWDGPTFAGIRAGMLAGRPTGRCAECSENILHHERAIRAVLP